MGPDSLGLGDDVARYEIWLSDSKNERFSEVRAYNIDRRAHAFERFAVFSNSLGGFDTLRVLGKVSQECDVTRATTRKERPAGQGLDFSELEIISITENSGIKFSTGFFERDADTYSDYMRELMEAEVVLLDTDYGFEALNIITSNMEYQKDRPGLVECTFEFQRTYSDKNYSRMPAAAALPSRPTKWMGVSSRAVTDAKGKRTGKLAWERLQKVYADDDSKVMPYAIKPNITGDPDYIQPIAEPSILAGTTPYTSKAINRAIDFKRSTCANGFLGTAPIVNIPAGVFGGAMPGAADELAEAKFETFNNQQHANTYGICEINNVPVHVAILHKIPMDGNLKEQGSNKYGPVPDLRVGGAEMISNTIGASPAELRTSTGTVTTGIKKLVIEIEYAGMPFQACKLKLVGKNKELTANGPGFYIFENVQINSPDAPLVVEVTPI